VRRKDNEARSETKDPVSQVTPRAEVDQVEVDGST